MFQNANHTAELPAKPTVQQQPCLGGQEREQCEVNCRARVLEDELQLEACPRGTCTYHSMARVT
jgi:hypothetical protein